jgi:uncharacterized membrane protein
VISSYSFKLYLLTLSVLFLLDILWLSVIAKEFYAVHLGYLMRSSILWLPALLFYVFNTIGILIFAVKPALKSKSISKAVVLGALYGLCTYGAYDFTNQATIKNWPLILTIVDLTWGIVLSAAVSGIGFSIGKRLQ